MQSRPRPRASIRVSNHAFTLIELLVVISIIALLAGLALPALSNAINSAKKAKANSMINQLKVAITAFNTEYGTWPGDNPGTAPAQIQNITLYPVLVGASANATSEAAGNTRDIPFMEFATADLDSSTAPTQFVDPWWKTSKDKTDQNYWIVLDYAYANVLTVPDVTQTTGNTAVMTGSAQINAGVAIGDPGPPLSGNVVNTGGNGNPSKMLHSW